MAVHPAAIGVPCPEDVLFRSDLHPIAGAESATGRKHVGLDGFRSAKVELKCGRQRYLSAISSRELTTASYTPEFCKTLYPNNRMRLVARQKTLLITLTAESASRIGGATRKNANFRGVID